MEVAGFFLEHVMLQWIGLRQNPIYLSIYIYKYVYHMQESIAFFFMFLSTKQISKLGVSCILATIQF